MVRKITVSDATIGDWAAITDLFYHQMRKGTFEDTVVVIWWDPARPSIALGPQEDAVQLNRPAAPDDSDVVFGRNLWSGGGTGLFVPEIPLVLVYYEDDRYGTEDQTLRHHFDEVNGQANMAALEGLGLDAEYDPIGDTEVVLDDTRYKVMSGSACNFDVPQYWAVVSSVIWEPLPEDLGRVYNEVTEPPKEKFEDKDTDSLTSRMRSIRQLLDDVDTETAKEAVVDAFVEENVSQVFGSDEEVVDSEWREHERRHIERVGPYFESEGWIDRFSTRNLCQQAPDDAEIGIAAYKSRKLLKASIIVDNDGRIDSALFTGDFFMRPVMPTVSRTPIDALTTAIEGLQPTDEAALESALETALARAEVEIPMIDAEDLVAPVTRAASNTQPVRAYLADDTAGTNE